MSIATELSRLQTDRNTIRNKLIELGLATSTSNLDALATAIDGIIKRGAVSINVKEGETYTIPAGYHDGTGTVSGVAGGGNYTLQSKMVTPTKKQQSVTPDSGYYGLSDVAVAPIPDAYQDVSTVTAAAGDVLAGKVYVTSDGVVTTGTMTNNGAISKTLDVTTVSYTIPKGYHNGSGTVRLEVQTKTVTPTKSPQFVTPDAGMVLNKVAVGAIPAAYQDVTGVTATADHVLDGDVFVDAEGAEVEGTMPNNGALSGLLKTNATSYTIPAGYTSGGKVEAKFEVGVKTVTPTKVEQTVTGEENSFLVGVTVGPIPDEYMTTTDTTATTADILTGKTAYTGGQKVVGAMPNVGAQTKTLDATADNQAVTLTKGYHSGTGKVQIVLEEKSATPTKSTQTVTPTDGKVLSKVTVNPIPANYMTTTDTTAAAADILTGKTAYINGAKATGTMPSIASDTHTLDATTGNQSFTIPLGFHEGDGNVQIVLEEKSTTPTKSAQTLTPTAGKVLSKVTVNAIPAAYQDVTQVSATAADVLVGATFVDSNGKVTLGAMPNNGSVTTTIDGLTNVSATIPAGYTTGGTVSLTSDIEDALAAI